MVKRQFAIILTVAALFAATQLVKAQESSDDVRTSFFLKGLGEGWLVVGYKYKDQTNPVCAAEYSWKDGSHLLLGVDLVDNELWIRMKNMTWNNTAFEYKKFMTSRINYYVNKTLHVGNDAEFRFVSKNMIYISNIRRDQFIQNFRRSNNFTIVMPGNFDNIRLMYSDGAGLLRTLQECIRDFADQSSIPSLEVKPIPKVKGESF